MAARNVSGVTLLQFFTAVLQGLGAPVTSNNLAKLGAIAAFEGHGGDYNPFNYVVGPGSDFNSVGVKNYPDVRTGVAQTIRLLNGSRTTLQGAKANLMSDGSYAGWIGNMGAFYQSWGGSAPNISQSTAAAKLNSQIDGPRDSSWYGPTALPRPIILPPNVNNTNLLPAITYHNWVTQGWTATNQYTGLSPHLQGMMEWLLSNYGGRNLGGYGRRGIKANPSLPSAHASGAAIDWGYGDRATAQKVMDLIASDPNRYGIQEVHDYSGLRDWRVGRGWLAQALGSHGGDMRPGNQWLHLEVSPERYKTPWSDNPASGGAPGAPGGPSGPSSASSMAATMRSILFGSLAGAAPSRRGIIQPSAMATLALSAPPSPKSDPILAPQAAKPSFDIRYYAGGPQKIPTAAQSLKQGQGRL